MESVETQFEEVMVTVAEGAGEQAADFSVDAFHFFRRSARFYRSLGHPWHGEVGYRHGLELPDPAGFCFGAPFAQEPQALGPSLAPRVLRVPP